MSTKYSTIPTTAPPRYPFARDPPEEHSQPGGVPDDFKFGVDVYSSSVEIRMAFVRKVYSILGAQLLLTSLVAVCMMYNPSVKMWTQQNPWATIVTILLTFVTLGLLYWKRYSVPWNYILLTAFTVLEAFAIGSIVALYDTELVLKAFLLTAGVVAMLTSFTLQTKYDFQGWYPFLYGALWIIIILSIIQIFLPFSKGFDMFIAVVTALVFVGLILFDTQLLFRLSPEEYILASISLYLDILNLFLAILRILKDRD